MRPPPTIEMRFRPYPAVPGGSVTVEAVLEVDRPTPVKFVFVELRGMLGHSATDPLFDVPASRWGPTVLPPGRHRYDASFDLPEDAPPSYRGRTIIEYTARVVVGIPWWLDHECRFVLPVVLGPSPPVPPQPALIVSSLAPSAAEPFLELSVDDTQVTPGERVTGHFSIQNLRGRKIRRVDLTFVEYEHGATSAFVDERRRFTARLHDGAPPEGEAVPFRVFLPDEATPTFASSYAGVRTELEVRAVVVAGRDLVLATGILVRPRGSTGADVPREVAPVGRERQRRGWEKVAAQHGLTCDASGDRMVGRRGDVTIEVASEERRGAWLVARLAWPSFGLDLEVSDRRFRHALAVGAYRSGDAAADARFVVRARDHVQVKTALPNELLGVLARFEEVTVSDRGATLALRAAPHGSEVGTFVADVVAAASTLADVEVPPPPSFREDLPAWEAMAARLRGRLERGGMWIRDGQVGTNAVEVGSRWDAGGSLLGSALVVRLDPPLAVAPKGLDDHALSPLARDRWRALAVDARAVDILADRITVEIDGKLTDPQAAMPMLDAAVALAAALGGIVGGGPFR